MNHFFNEQKYSFYIDRTKIIKKAAIKILITSTIITGLALVIQDFSIIAILAYFFGYILCFLYFEPNLISCIKFFFISKPIIEIDKEGLNFYGYGKIQWDNVGQVETAQLFPLDDSIEITVFTKIKIFALQQVPKQKELESKKIDSKRSKTIKYNNILNDSVNFIAHCILTFKKNSKNIEVETELSKKVPYIELKQENKELILFPNKKGTRKATINSFVLSFVCLSAAWIAYNTNHDIWVVPATAGPIFFISFIVAIFKLFSIDYGKPTVIINPDGITLLPCKNIAWNEIKLIFSNFYGVNIEIKNKNNMVLYNLTKDTDELVEILTKYHLIYSGICSKENIKK